MLGEEVSWSMARRRGVSGRRTWLGCSGGGLAMPG